MSTTAMAADGSVGSAVNVPIGKYLIFQLDGEEYGIQVSTVREIIRVHEMTFVPQMRADIKGVINLRDHVIPIVDLRLKLGLAEAAVTQHTSVIVIHLQGAAGSVAGILVDGVADVISLTAADVEDPADVGRRLMPAYLLGFANLKGRVILLLEVGRLLTASGNWTALARQ